MVLKASWSGLVDRILEFFPHSKEEERLFYSVWVPFLVSGRGPDSSETFTTITIVTIVTMTLLMMMEGLTITVMSEEEG